MRNFLMIPVALFAVACGYSEESFSEDFVDAYCTAYDSCNTGDDACPVTVSEDGGDEETECEFDAAAAKDCVDGEFVCDDSLGEGFEYPTPPSACSNVVTCPDVAE